MVDDVSYLIKPTYLHHKIDLNSPTSNGQYPWSEMANHLSRKKTSVYLLSFYYFELNFSHFC